MNPSPATRRSRDDPSLAIASTAAIAAASAHALNNLLSALYATSAYLEEIESPMAKRADATLAKAVAAGKALSCAMYLISLEPADIPAIRATPTIFARCDSDSIGRLSRQLQDTARIDLLDESEGKISDLVLPLDTDTLEALLLCTAFIERRESGADARLEARLLPPQPGAAPAIQVLFQGKARLTGLDSAQTHSLHPCSLALSHAKVVLRGLSIDIADRGAEGIAITIPAVS